MLLGPDYQPEFDSLRDFLLEIAPERSVEHLLKKVVQRLAERPHAVLARVWQIEQESNAGYHTWYPDPETMRYCFFSKPEVPIHIIGAQKQKRSTRVTPEPDKPRP